MSEISYPENFSEFVVGENHSVMMADNPRTNSSAALNLILQARRSIDIFTHTLDPRILDTPEIASAIINFAKISPNSRVRILLCDPSIVMKSGHGFIALSRKLSSFFFINKTHDDYLTTPFNFLMVDNKAILYRPHAHEYHSIVNFNAAADCRKHLEFFETVWSLSEPTTEIRQLMI